jgi:hypothetical protein
MKRQAPVPPKINSSQKFDEKRQTLSHHKKVLRPTLDISKKVSNKKRQKEALKYMCESLPEVLEQTRKEDIPKHLLDILRTILKQFGVSVAADCACKEKCNSAHCNCFKIRMCCNWMCECSGYCKNSRLSTRKKNKNL